MSNGGMISVQGVCKDYGKKSALKDISFNIEKGKIVGLLGESGSGKTTMMKILSGIISSNEGCILIDEQKVNEVTKGYVSLLTELNAYPLSNNLQDIIDLYKMFYKDFDEVLCMNLLERIHLKNQLNQKLKSLSKGMLQKFRLVMVMSRNAKVFLLDEPLGGIDVLAREEILDIIAERLASDAVILITTHLVKEVEQLLDDVIVIHDGELIGQYRCEEIRGVRGHSIEEYLKEVLRNERVAAI